MRIAIQNPTYRNVLAIDRARGNVTGTDVLRKRLVAAVFSARHVRHPRVVLACLQALTGLLKQAAADAASMLEPSGSSMSGPQRWLAERGLARAVVTSA